MTAVDHTASPEPPFSGRVAISIPADPRLVRALRLATGGVAALMSFDVEAIDDLRIGVDELVTSLIERGDGSSVQFELSAVGPESLRIDGSAPVGDSPADDDRFEISHQILSVIADDHGFGVDGDRATAWLTRSAGADTADDGQP